MNTRTFIYSLKTFKDRPILSIDLMSNILTENNDRLELQLPTGIVTLPKAVYLNKFKVFDNGSVFFFVCNKQVDRDFVYKKLIDYACNKIDCRINYLESLKHSYKRLIAA